MTQPSTVDPTHRLFGDELADAVTAALAAMPEVARVTHLRYWDRHTFFVVLDANDAATRARVDEALSAFLNGPGSGRLAGVSWRYLSAADPVPSSRTLYRRDPAPARAF